MFIAVTLHKLITMSLRERKENLLRQVSNIDSEETIAQLEELMAYVLPLASTAPHHLPIEEPSSELRLVVALPLEKSVFDDIEFRKLFTKWGK